jgi:hypothetical protein
VLWAFIALVAVQCFVFPYGAEHELMRIIEALEGAVVFGLLTALLYQVRFDKKKLMDHKQSSAS